MTIEDLLKQYSIPHLYSGHRHCTKGFVQFDCPLCSPSSHKYRMGYSLNKHYTHCWVCGHVNLVKVATLLFGIDSKAARSLQKPSASYERRFIATYQLKLPEGICELTEAHKSYLLKRNFQPEVIQSLWGVKGIKIGHPLAYRILIPIHDRFGKMVSWTARSIIPNAMRYHSAKKEEESTPHKSVLYGANKAGLAIIIVEGPTDVWRIGPGAVATFGTSWTPAQIREMIRYPVRVVCFDKEEEAQQKAKKLCSLLQVYSGETYRVVLSGDDPDSSDLDEITELRKRFGL